MTRGNIVLDDGALLTNDAGNSHVIKDIEQMLSLKGKVRALESSQSY